LWSRQWLPLFIYYFRSAHFSETISMGSLAEMLHTSQGYEEFYKHLQIEYSLENLLFWQEVGLSSISISMPESFV
jgi:hypothetical protein